MKATMTEAEWTHDVLALAKLYRWRSAHFRGVRVQRANGSIHYQTPVQGDGKGFPDLILLRGPQLIAAELKVGKNTTTPEQEAWLVALVAAGARSFVWRPEDWDRIKEILE